MLSKSAISGDNKWQKRRERNIGQMYAHDHMKTFSISSKKKQKKKSHQSWIFSVIPIRRKVFAFTHLSSLFLALPPSPSLEQVKIVVCNLFLNCKLQNENGKDSAVHGKLSSFLLLPQNPACVWRNSSLKQQLQNMTSHTHRQCTLCSAIEMMNVVGNFDDDSTTSPRSLLQNSKAKVTFYAEI